MNMHIIGMSHLSKLLNIYLQLSILVSHDFHMHSQVSMATNKLRKS